MSTAVVVLLGPVAWSPPGVNRADWRAALAEDVVDVVSTLSGVEPAIAATGADTGLAGAIRWPGMAGYEVLVGTVNAALAAAGAAGHSRAAILCADAPDLPALLIGKLLRPLTSREVAVAPGLGGGLLGVASRLPVPAWLPTLDLDDDAGLAKIRAAAPTPSTVASTPGWLRQRGRTELGALDPALEGWLATRALLGD